MTSNSNFSKIFPNTGKFQFVHTAISNIKMLSTNVVLVWRLPHPTMSNNAQQKSSNVGFVGRNAALAWPRLS